MDWWWFSGWPLIWIAGLCLGIVGLYSWTALCLYLIAKKTDTQEAWVAWIPILNLLVICWAAGRPSWWFFLLLIPLVNIVVYIEMWMTIAEVRNQETWIGLLMIIPGVNLVLLGILAFAPK